MTENTGSYPEVVIRGAGSFHLPGLGDGRIAGSGRISSRSIESKGASSLPGGLKTERIDTGGSAHIHGDLEAGKASFQGSAHIEGDFKFHDAESKGSLHVAGDAEGASLESSGSTHVEGSLKLSGRLTSRGGLKAEAGVEAAEVEFKGALQTRGRLTAKRFSAVLGGATSRIGGGVAADQVIVERGDTESWFSDPELITPSIAGGDIRIDYVTCESVTGRRVEIGRYCRVKGPVKYSESVTVHPNASLAEPPTRIENI
jgi:cytoskeletal protein CcmA (bactofilin family)